jgi:hypothetical protein
MAMIQELRIGTEKTASGDERIEPTGRQRRKDR